MVYAVDNELSFFDLDDRIDELNEFCKNKKLIKFLVGNKKDSDKRKISFEKGKKYAEKN